MPKQLTLDEMLIAASQSNMPGLNAYLAQLTQLAEDLAQDLAAHLNVDGPVFVDFTAEEGCGLMGGFAPLVAGHPIPEVLRNVDTTADWEPRNPMSGAHPAGMDAAEADNDAPHSAAGQRMGAAA